MLSGLPPFNFFLSVQPSRCPCNHSWLLSYSSSPGVILWEGYFIWTKLEVCSWLFMKNNPRYFYDTMHFKGMSYRRIQRVGQVRDLYPVNVQGPFPCVWERMWSLSQLITTPFLLHPPGSMSFLWNVPCVEKQVIPAHGRSSLWLSPGASASSPMLLKSSFLPS